MFLPLGLYLKQVSLDCHLSTLNIIFAHVICHLLILKHLKKELGGSFSSLLFVLPRSLESPAGSCSGGWLRAVTEAGSPGKGREGCKGGDAFTALTTPPGPPLDAAGWELWVVNCTARSEEPTEYPIHPKSPVQCQLLLKEAEAN